MIAPATGEVHFHDGLVIVAVARSHHCPLSRCLRAIKSFLLRAGNGTPLESIHQTTADLRSKSFLALRTEFRPFFLPMSIRNTRAIRTASLNVEITTERLSPRT